jgi:hypothetical protein
MVKVMMAILAAAALVLTTGSRQPEPAGNVVAPVDAALDRAFVIGRWGPDAACAQIVEFHADGR